MFGRARGGFSSYFTPHFQNKLLNDSKKLSEKQRSLLRPIIEKEATAWGVGIVSPQEIDEINILNASFLAMHRAIEQLKQKPEQLLIDGNRFNTYKDIPHHCIVKGDGKFLSIAAASILAKTYRDEIMEKLDLEFDSYAWKNNKGYPTAEHRKAIQENRNHSASQKKLSTSSFSTETRF